MTQMPKTDIHSLPSLTAVHSLAVANDTWFAVVGHDLGVSSKQHPSSCKLLSEPANYSHMDHKVCAPIYKVCATIYKCISNMDWLVMGNSIGQHRWQQHQPISSYIHQATWHQLFLDDHHHFWMGPHGRWSTISEEVVVVNKLMVQSFYTDVFSSS